MSLGPSTLYLIYKFFFSGLSRLYFRLYLAWVANDRTLNVMSLGPPYWCPLDTHSQTSTLLSQRTFQIRVSRTHLILLIFLQWFIGFWNPQMQKGTWLGKDSGPYWRSEGKVWSCYKHWFGASCSVDAMPGTRPRPTEMLFLFRLVR